MSDKHKHNRREFIQKMGMTCAAMGSTTLLSGITNMGLLNAAASANSPVYSQANNYKALVCVFLNGGNDSFNMLVPRGTSEYNQYAEVRSGTKIEQSELLPINALNTDGKLYGLHPRLTNIQNLFESGKAAFVANVGTLIAPTTLTDFNSQARNPKGLFSHSDQAQQWQTSLPQERNARGWGGRLADILRTNNANENISMSISLSGLNTFQRGNVTQAYSIQSTDTGNVNINGFNDTSFYETIKRQSLDNILDVNHQNILRKAYANTVSGSIGTSLEFGSAINAGTPITTTFSNSDLSQRLNMVARTIAARNILNVQNQTFFVHLSGFDTHSNSSLRHAGLLSSVDDALGSFQESLEELGVSEQVTTFTISDFGRKLASNGDGTDHAWGGNSIVMGGAVQGQRIYGQYPELNLGNSLDVGGGRLIPTTSCDEYFAELALWFGASSSDIDLILPNINNFWTPTANSGPIGFMG